MEPFPVSYQERLVSGSRFWCFHDRDRRQILECLGPNFVKMFGDQFRCRVEFEDLVQVPVIHLRVDPLLDHVELAIVDHETDIVERRFFEREDGGVIVAMQSATSVARRQSFQLMTRGKRE